MIKKRFIALIFSVIALCSVAHVWAAAPLVGGIVYHPTTNGWLPARGVGVRLLDQSGAVVQQQHSWANGTFLLPNGNQAGVRLVACEQINDVVWLDMVTNLSNANTLFLRPTQLDNCPFVPTPALPDLRISPPTVTRTATNTWGISVTISNTTPVTVTQPFFVDGFIRDWEASTDSLDRSHGGSVVAGIGANSAKTISLTLAAPLGIAVERRLVVRVDSAEIVPESNESNNTASTLITPTATIDTLALMVLAFDNPSYSLGNLTPVFDETLQGIREASAHDPTLLAAVLVDLDGSADSHILLVHNGDILPVTGLPQDENSLSTDTYELNVADGQTLGRFFQWARTQFPTEKTTIMLYGHGAPLMPETDLGNIFGNNDSGSREPIPLPSWIFGSPTVTDFHPRAMWTPYQLSVALDMATNGGAQKVDVVDLVHCFSMSIEESYEIAPYTETIAGSPNFAYFEATLPGAALRALAGEKSAETLASDIITAYDDALPEVGYPRQFTAVDSSELPAVKTHWDAVSADLLTIFDIDPITTRANLQTAYANSAKFDTTACNPDWELSPPDALSDLHDFASQLAALYGQNSSLGTAAMNTAAALENAVIASRVKNGVPYYASTESEWLFDGLGVSFYSDMLGVERNGATVLTYHYDYYTDEVSAANPHPFHFIQGDQTWADVLQRFWQGETVQSAACLLTFPPSLSTGEVALVEFVTPQIGTTQVGKQMLPTVLITSADMLRNADVHFTVEQAGTVVYSETVTTGHLEVGSHWLAAEIGWTPTVTGSFVLTATLDPANFIVEPDESNNTITFTDSVQVPSGALNVATAIWVTDPVLSFASNAAQLRVQAFQFDNAGNPTLVTDQLVNVADGGGELSADFAPGLIRLHIWADASEPQLRFVNYAPAHAPLAAGERTCYAVGAAAGDSLQIQLNVTTGDANAFLWYPNNHGQPNLAATKVGSDALVVSHAPQTGRYLLCIYATNARADAEYTLSVAQNEPVFLRPTTTDQAAFVPNRQPHFNAPALGDSVPTAVGLISVESTAAISPIMIVMGVVILLTLSVCRKSGFRR